VLDDENLNRAEPTRTGGRSGTGRAEHGSSRTDLASGSVTTPLAHGRCQYSSEKELQVSRPAWSRPQLDSLPPKRGGNGRVGDVLAGA